MRAPFRERLRVQEGKYESLKQARGDEDDLVRRATAAWFRSGGMDQPRKTGSCVEEHDGKLYVVLRNVRSTMAVYRIRAYDGVLKRLRRWPKGLDA